MSETGEIVTGAGANLSAWMWAIPLAPLAASLLTAAMGQRGVGRRAHWPTLAGLFVSLVMSSSLLAVLTGRNAYLPLLDGVSISMQRSEPATTITGVEHAAAAPASVELPKHRAAVAHAVGYEWIRAGSLVVRLDLKADTLAAIMLVMVTFVSFLVAVYAGAYMDGDPGTARFFAAMSLFVFSMCMLVLSPNFLAMFVFWEAVGLCSYLLIGFWFARPSAAAAARKAFLVNRIGDFGFLLGVFLIFTTFGSVDFTKVFADTTYMKELASEHGGLLTTICLLLFVGAVGKSAQFPLMVWLPDAMEGPTPVSALIHAATMVTAGVYMVARCSPLYMHAPEAQMVIACVGGATALLAALIALTQHDLKQVLAYSTISQLGYMFMALGSAAAGPEYLPFAVTAAQFHLFTHAFFKALLFLTAGSVMHAMGDVIDMRRFSGLRHALPCTHVAYLVGAATLAGLPLLSGFWSKDEVLVALEIASHHGPHASIFGILKIVALATAFLTAIYTFRSYFLTFWGPEKFPEEAGEHPHESPAAMLWPLALLSACSVGLGLMLGPTGTFADTLGRTPGLEAHGHHELHWGVMIASTVAAVAGFLLAYLMFIEFRDVPAEENDTPGYQLSLNKFYLDPLYNTLIVWPCRAFAVFCDVFDRYFVDGLVDLAGWIPGRVGAVLRPIQNGLAQTYALLMALGLAAFVIAAMRTAG